MPAPTTESVPGSGTESVDAVNVTAFIESKSKIPPLVLTPTNWLTSDGELSKIGPKVCGGCLNVFGMAAAVDEACSGFLGKAGTETLPYLQAR